jgi:pimeloyl-ACP methyl ester carboxylesterase
MLGSLYEVLAPEHYGCETSGPWTGEHAFTIADEAKKAIALVDGYEAKVHLVGHSYGGAVALHVAVSRPDRIASMALYEPAAFHLLRQMGEPGAGAYAEISSVARRVCEGVTTGDYRGAIAAFVDYWSGAGAWDAMRPKVQDALIRYAPKGPLDFQAAISDSTRVSAYRELNFPILILRGEHTKLPTRLIADGLSELLPRSRRLVLDGAGHMGPVTHASEVSAQIMRHIIDAGVRRQPQYGRLRSRAYMLGAAARMARAVP